MPHPPVVIDTNIFFSALLSQDSRFATLIQRSDYRFFICEYVVIELFKHKEKIAQHSRLSEEELLLLYYNLLRKVTIYKEDLISPENRRSAFTLCQDIDEADTPHVALTLELGGLLWTGDKKLRDGLREEGFTRFFDHRKTND